MLKKILSLGFSIAVCVLFAQRELVPGIFPSKPKVAPEEAPQAPSKPPAMRSSPPIQSKNPSMGAHQGGAVPWGPPPSSSSSSSSAPTQMLQTSPDPRPPKLSRIGRPETPMPENHHQAREQLRQKLDDPEFDNYLRSQGIDNESLDSKQLKDHLTDFEIYKEDRLKEHPFIARLSDWAGQIRQETKARSYKDGRYAVTTEAFNPSERPEDPESLANVKRSYLPGNPEVLTSDQLDAQQQDLVDRLRQKPKKSILKKSPTSHVPPSFASPSSPSSAPVAAGQDPSSNFFSLVTRPAEGGLTSGLGGGELFAPSTSSTMPFDKGKGKTPNDVEVSDFDPSDYMP